MVAAFIYLVGCWFGRPQKDNNRRIDIEKLACTLGQIRVRIRSGSFDWRPADTDHDLPPAVGDVIEAAWLEGKSVLDSLASLEHQLSLAIRLASEQFELRRLYWSRSALVGLVAFGVGYLHQGDQAAVTDIRQEFMSGVLAVGVFLAGSLLIKSSTSIPWVALSETKDENVAVWLAAHINGETSPQLEWANSLSDLASHEFSRGVSLLVEKRRLLEDWSEAQFRVSRQRLTLVADLMPIGEIVGLGIPLIVLLFQCLN